MEHKQGGSGLIVLIVGAACLSLALLVAKPARGVGAQSSVSPNPSTITAGMGAPTMPCGSGMASATSTSFYDQRDITSGNSVFKCKLLPDGVTYAWVPPFTTPILGTSVTIGGSLLVLNSTITGTATVTGALKGQNCIATRSDGTLPPAGMIIDCAVTADNTATVRLTALIAATPSATTYAVRVIP